MNEVPIDRKLDLQIANATGIKIYYNDWDIKQEIPLYIPSGKSWKTHSMEARPLPSYHKNYGSAFSLLDFLAIWPVLNWKEDLPSGGGAVSFL